MSFTGDGDLQAVVRGSANGCSDTTAMDGPSPFFASFTSQQDDFNVFGALTYPDLFETSAVLDELEELYKPFYPMLNPLISPQTILSSSISISRGEREPEKNQEKEPFTESPVVAAATTAHGVKHRKRKNQHKRVVLQVTADGLSSDKWSWRKYGQKPIKGSLYPRSYYRCSSSKGCLARKQVERSHSDPEMFVITYTAEHCHSQPTRRNSLAGITRRSFSNPKSSTCVLSPRGPSLQTIDEESSQEGIKKESTEEDDDDEQRMDEASEHNGLLISDDFFVGFEQLDRLTSDLPYNGDLHQQCTMAFPC